MLNDMCSSVSYLGLYILTIACGVAHAMAPKQGRLVTRLASAVWRLVLCAVAVVYLGMTLLPMESIHKSPDIPFKRESHRLHQALQPFHASNSYGDIFLGHFCRH